MAQKFVLVLYRDGRASASLVGQVIADTPDRIIVSPAWNNQGESEDRTISRERIICTKTLIVQKG